VTGLPRNTIVHGDAIRRLSQLPTGSVDCVVTSPPYYQLRDYDVPDQFGLEASVDGWVSHLRAVMAEVARVLKPTGSVWLNLADSYSRHPRYGAPAKAQLLGPERLLLALAADGWLCRNKVIWAKPNPMPHSVGDRLTTTYEVVYFLVRLPRYYFDLDAIRVPHRSRGRRHHQPAPAGVPAWAGPLAGSQSGLRRARPDGVPGHRLGKNPGDVWTIPTAGYRGAHFATFPEALVLRPLLATCPERICTACGTPWRHISSPGSAADQESGILRPITTVAAPLAAACRCHAPAVPGVVLDPFFGTGTVGVVARRTGRDWIGVELNADFIDLARQRLTAVDSAAIAA
jgi:DNA modification methylase